MEAKTSLKPKSYLSNYNHLTLKLIGFPEMGDLEKAIVGYVISNSVVTNGTKYERSASYADIRELVFEYYKMYPHIHKNFARRTKEYQAKIESISSTVLFHGPSPFQAYVNNIITNLILLGVFTKGRGLGRKYVTYNPKIRFSSRQQL
jgi:hypothetical protein